MRNTGKKLTSPTTLTQYCLVISQDLDLSHRVIAMCTHKPHTYSNRQLVAPGFWQMLRCAIYYSLVVSMVATWPLGCEPCQWLHVSHVRRQEGTILTLVVGISRISRHPIERCCLEEIFLRMCLNN